MRTDPNASTRALHLAWVAAIDDAELRADDTQIIVNFTQADLNTVAGRGFTSSGVTRFNPQYGPTVDEEDELYVWGMT